MDHAGGTAALKAATGVPIEGPHQDDAFWIDRIAESGQRYGMPEAQPFTPDRWLEDGDTRDARRDRVGGLPLPRPHARAT